MSCRQYGYPWPSLATSPYHSSLLAGPQGYIPYPHIAAVCMFELVVLLLLGHMWGVHGGTSVMSSSLLLQQYWTHYHHHHRLVLVARISMTLSCHFSQSFIASGRSSGLHPVSSHRSWMYVRAGRSAFAQPCVGVHKSTSLMSSSLLLQQCPACLVFLTWIVFVIGGRWPYSWYLVGCCRQDLFNIACSILV